MALPKKSGIIYGFFGIAFLVWLCLFALIARSDILEENEKSSRLLETRVRLNATKKELDGQIQMNRYLEKLLENHVRNVGLNLTVHLPKLNQRNSKNIDREPSFRYEQLRRRIKTNINEFYNFLQYESIKLEHETAKSMAHMLGMANDMKLSLLSDMEKLRTVDGFDGWRFKESRRLTNIVRKRIWKQQNPPDCSQARKILFAHRNECGFGCQIHHMVNSFTLAYEDGRTLLLQPKNWNYHEGGFESIFQPLSRTCENDDSQANTYWPDQQNQHQVVRVRTTYFENDDESRKQRPPFFPSAIPSDLAPTLMKLHGESSAWWVGNILKYFLDMRPEIQNKIDEGMQRLGFKKPIVGVHVRRTDKLIREAGFHSLEEYMKPVDEYYDKLELTEKVEKRRVFLASDEPDVLREAAEKYPHYEIIADYEATSKASNLSSRFSTNSLMGFLLDLHLLSISDFIVCTLSSEVCRLAFELMQTHHVDAWDRVYSNDFIYYYNGHPPYYYETLIPHIPRFSDEIEAQVGDALEIFTGANHHVGLIHVTNTRTGKTGKVPRFKLKRRAEIVEFSLYKNLIKLD